MKQNGAMHGYTSVEICAGGGGQALGLEQAGFHHVSLVENDEHCCNTLRANRPDWNVIHTDVRSFAVPENMTVDLLAGGVPCPPFSVAGRQLGASDERDLFPEALRLVRECAPRAVLLENVRGIMQPAFSQYRADIQDELQALGYETRWELLLASDYGVPQLRPRAVLVALRPETSAVFAWPAPNVFGAPTVGEVLADAMGSGGWEGASEWVLRAGSIAPTIVGGSKKHGGPDLGPTRAREAWARLGVDGRGLADAPPERGFRGYPRLTVEMVALLQGFPPDWKFVGGKTSAYRQVGNAFPPPVARSVGEALGLALARADNRKEGAA